MQNRQTILIIDEIQEDINILIKLLNKYDCVTAFDARTAIDIAFVKENIELILLNITIPDMDSFEICKILQENSKTKHIPIIFLGEKNKQADLQKGFKMGVADYVTKPFNHDELISRVSTHLKLISYERNLKLKVQEEVQKSMYQECTIHQQSKQAALGELLMHIAHQWKQPLASLISINILNKIKIETGSVLSNEDYLKSIDKSENLIMFMSDTIDTFKNFYMPSNENKNFFIADAVIEILSIIEATFYFDNIKIYIISHEKEESFGNVNEFSQVIFSILNNAREIFKIRNIEEPEIHIAIENKTISIRDNGGGITDCLFEDIFLPAVSTCGSTGIGLYLSKNLITKNNGVITASNDKDGAVFTIEFLTWIN